MKAVLAVWLVLAFGAGAVASGETGLARCDRLYAEGDVAASIVTARTILEDEPSNYEAAWRLSRALISAGNLADDEDRMRGHYEEARDLARRAIELNPGGSGGYTCLAVCQGHLAGYEKGAGKIEMADKARAAAVRAIELDAANDLAHLVLGVWNREIATVGGLTKFAAKVFYGGIPEGASLEESETCLRRAVALRPDYLNHRRELAITLLELEKPEEAVAELEVAVGLSWKQPQDPWFHEDALKLLQETRMELEEKRSRHW